MVNGPFLRSSLILSSFMRSSSSTGANRPRSCSGVEWRKPGEDGCVVHKEPVLQMKGISKQFPGVQALKDVDFSVLPGEVHCLVGENGAGKSTLIKIMTGAQPKDAGTILINGTQVEMNSPRMVRTWASGPSTKSWTFCRPCPWRRTSLWKIFPAPAWGW